MSPDKVTTYLENKLSDGLKPATVAHHLALLKHSFTMAVKWGLLPNQPFRDVHLPVKVNNARLRYLSSEEIGRLLAVAPPHLHPIIMTGLHTGMRKGEILSLRWDQVDLPHQVILLTDTKNGEQRGIPLNQTRLGRLFAVLGRLNGNSLLKSRVDWNVLEESSTDFANRLAHLPLTFQVVNQT